MKIFNSYIHCLSVCLLFTGLLFSCKSKPVCIEERQKSIAPTVSIKGPDHLHVGEQVSIIVGIANNISACVKESDASFTGIGFDSLLITSQLSFTKDQSTAGCECKSDSIVYTLLYFTPLNKGTYYFFAEKPDPNVTNAPPSQVKGFTITVD